MDCQRVERLLPLHAGGDLADGRERARLAAHLEGCAACRLAADGWAESMRLLRLERPPEFDAAFFEPIRRNVMREITAERTTAPAFATLLSRLLRPKPLAYAASLALVYAAIFFAIRLSRAPQPSRLTSGGVAATVNEQFMFVPETSKGTPHNTVAHKDGRRKTAARDLPARKGRPAPRGSAATNKTTTPRVEEDGPAAPGLLTAGAELAVVKDEREMLKIDLRTSDPDVRIIWFSPRPDAESSPRITNDKR